MFYIAPRQQRFSDEQIERLGSLSTSTLGHFSDLGAIASLQPIQRPIRLLGTALTVKIPHIDGSIIREALIQAEPGDVLVKIDPRYFRPAEVETLLGDPAKAKKVLGWEPEITAQEMCAEMVGSDLRTARRHALLKQHGYELPISIEQA